MLQVFNSGREKGTGEGMRQTGSNLRTEVKDFGYTAVEGCKI